MKLKEVLYDGAIIFGDESVEVLGVSYDSRVIGKKYAFFALPGDNSSGYKYIDEAVRNGVSVIVVTSKCSINTVTQVVVKDIFHFMSIFCAKFYNYPDRELNIIGITGTNGKTTTSYMIESILIKSGIECGVIGTINYRYKNKIIDANNTTPQSLDTYKIMREMVDNDIKYLVMEVSSHALTLGRVYGIDFDIAIFTNLTQDHLDFHKNMDNYFESKSILFRYLGTKTKKNKKYAIINVDDKYGEKLSRIKINAEIGLYSTLEESVADFKAEKIKITSSGSRFDVVFNNEKAKISIKHVGLHNVYNALAALTAGIYCGISFMKVVEGLIDSEQVPGRLERIDTKDMGFDVFVDYAHTDDALKNVLKTLKEIDHVRIITVFGCGGNRDRAKRPLMGKVAVEVSDFVFVTSDNPRTEDPNKIILDIEVGIKRAYKGNYKIVIDRNLAIKEAIMMADRGDIVIIAGKGHESYQIMGVEKIHFDDIKVVKKYIDLKKQEKSTSKKLGQMEFIF